MQIGSLELRLIHKCWFSISITVKHLSPGNDGGKLTFLNLSPQLITYGDTREEALTTMAKALDNYCIKGNWCLWVCVGQCSTDC